MDCKTYPLVNSSASFLVRIFSILLGIGNSDNELIWDNCETVLVLVISALSLWISGSSTRLRTITSHFIDSGILQLFRSVQLLLQKMNLKFLFFYFLIRLYHFCRIDYFVNRNIFVISWKYVVNSPFSLNLWKFLIGTINLYFIDSGLLQLFRSIQIFTT